MVKKKKKGVSHGTQEKVECGLRKNSNQGLNIARTRQPVCVCVCVSQPIWFFISEFSACSSFSAHCLLCLLMVHVVCVGVCLKFLPVVLSLCTLLSLSLMVHGVCVCVSSFGL